MLPFSRRRHEFLRARGDAARDARNWAGAATLYAKYLESAPSDFGIWVQHGHMCKEAGNLAEAERSYLRALALEPQNADLHLQFGHLMKMRDEPGRALAHYQTAARLDPGMEDAAREVALLAPAEPARASEPQPAAPAFTYNDAMALVEEQNAILVDTVTALETRLAAQIEGINASVDEIRRVLVRLRSQSVNGTGGGSADGGDQGGRGA